jgi:hypothetical protein
MQIYQPVKCAQAQWLDVIPVCSGCDRTPLVCVRALATHWYQAASALSCPSTLARRTHVD